MSQVLHDNLLSECAELERLIKLTPEKSFVTRMSLEARLESVRDELEKVGAARIPGVQGTLSFRGLPVFESAGINATFAGEAVSSFENMVAARAASCNHQLSHSGRLPDRDQFRLMITGTVVGSFGFELEELRNQPEDENNAQQYFRDAHSVFESAIQDTINTLEIIRNGTDEEIADLIADADERTIREIKVFLKVLSKWEATCELEFDRHSFYFANTKELQSSVDRLADENIQEHNEPITGIFLGGLPKDRTFEFQCQSDDNVIKGKIAADISDPSDIIKYSYEQSLVKIQVHVTQVGKSKPKYKLLAVETIKSE